MALTRNITRKLTRKLKKRNRHTRHTKVVKRNKNYLVGGNNKIDKLINLLHYILLNNDNIKEKLNEIKTLLQILEKNEDDYKNDIPTFIHWIDYLLNENKKIYKGNFNKDKYKIVAIIYYDLLKIYMKKKTIISRESFNVSEKKNNSASQEEIPPNPGNLKRIEYEGELYDVPVVPAEDD
jgi:hypothetical protein